MVQYKETFPVIGDRYFTHLFAVNDDALEQGSAIGTVVRVQRQELLLAPPEANLLQNSLQRQLRDDQLLLVALIPAAVVEQGKVLEQRRLGWAAPWGSWSMSAIFWRKTS